MSESSASSSNRLRKVKARTPSGESLSVNLIGQPDACPLCHHKLVPLCHGAFVRGESSIDDIDEACQCTSSSCNAVFIASFKNDRRHNPPSCLFTASSPRSPVPPDVPLEVSVLSPDFVAIYTQALAAESHGLEHLTGIGLRKALEFLVKDFASSLPDAKPQEVQRRLLGECIHEYVKDASVKAVAKRAAWLGNDETHYVRKWTGKDVSDLKVLIRLTMNGIDNVLLAQKFEKEMPDAPRPPK